MINKFNIDNKQDKEINNIYDRLKRIDEKMDLMESKYIIDKHTYDNEAKSRALKFEEEFKGYFDDIINIDNRINDKINTKLNEEFFLEYSENLDNMINSVKENIDFLKKRNDEYKDELKHLNNEMDRLNNKIDNNKPKTPRPVEKLIPTIKITKRNKNNNQ